MALPKKLISAVCLMALFQGSSVCADGLSDLAVKADDYFQKNDVISAMPLYVQLTQQDPKNALFAERLAFCLVVQFNQLPEGEQRDIVRKRAKREAEAAFARGDLDTALAKYQELAASDAHSYEARLFAGDVYFRRRDFKQAADWFQKAIDVDPNREMAYRYWGDTLGMAGDHEGALAKYVDAIVAAPYDWKSWEGLQQWAKHNRATLTKPHVPTPKSPVVSPGIDKNVSISLDHVTGADWLVYSVTRASWQEETFAKRFPQEKKYRHSLVEEVEALQAVLLVRAQTKRTEKGPDSLDDLDRLSKDGMLEPYVLLSASDEGIARDYARYRENHREILRAYLRQYVVKR